MGDAADRLKRAGEPVAFDFRAPAYVIRPADQQVFRQAPEGDPWKAEDRIPWAATKLLLEVLSQMAFPGGMDRRDGSFWAAWVEATENTAPIVEITRGQLAWLKKLAGADDLKVPVPVTQWREALCAYLDTL